MPPRGRFNMIKLLSCYWCYVDNYPENFEEHKGVTFCYDCIYSHGNNNIKTIYKKFLYFTHKNALKVEINNRIPPTLQGGATKL